MVLLFCETGVPQGKARQPDLLTSIHFTYRDQGSNPGHISKRLTYKISSQLLGCSYTWHSRIFFGVEGRSILFLFVCFVLCCCCCFRRCCCCCLFRIQQMAANDSQFCVVYRCVDLHGYVRCEICKN